MCKPNIKNIKNILILHVSVISPWQWKQYQSCLSYGSMSSATNIVIYLTNSISRQFFDIIQFYLATNIVKYLGNFISGLFLISFNLSCTTCGKPVGIFLNTCLVAFCPDLSSRGSNQEENTFPVYHKLLLRI